MTQEEMAAALEAREQCEGAGEEEEEDDEMPEEFKGLPHAEQRRKVIQLSCKQMLIGTILVLLFSDPMVDVLVQIGKQTGIPAFYVSFVLAPIASNASELVSSYKLAAKKTQSSITQSLQTLEGAACMNNSFVTCIFMYLIYFQGLAWKFTAETLSIVLVQLIMFFIIQRSKQHSMSEAFVVVLLYPIALLFVYVLEAAGWD